MELIVIDYFLSSNDLSDEISYIFSLSMEFVWTSLNVCIICNCLPNCFTKGF